MAQTLQAGSKFPDITIPKLGGGTVTLADKKDGHDWKMVIVYRGVHCPLCTRYMKELNDALPKLTELGVDLVVLSADNQEQAERHMTEVNPDYDIGYDLNVAQMQELGLYISGAGNGRNVERPFAEPGLFVINEHGTLQIIDISNAPFARPSVASMLMGISFYRGMAEPFPINGTEA